MPGVAVWVGAGGEAGLVDGGADGDGDPGGALTPGDVALGAAAGTGRGGAADGVAAGALERLEPQPMRHDTRSSAMDGILRVMMFVAFG